MTERKAATYTEAIKAVLREPQNGGLFKHEVTKPTGEKVS